MQQLTLDFEEGKKGLRSKSGKKEHTEKKEEGIEDVRSAIKDKALQVASKELVGKESIDLSNPEDTTKALNKIGEYLKKTWVQKGVNKAVEKLDTMDSMESIRNKWDSLSPAVQTTILASSLVTGAILPAAPAFYFLVTTGLLTYKGAPTKKDLEEKGKIVRPVVTGGVEVLSWFKEDFQKIKPFVEPFLQVIESLDSVMLNANEHLKEARKTRRSIN